MSAFFFEYFKILIADKDKMGEIFKILNFPQNKKSAVRKFIK